jgi:hypothetical protein
MSVPGHCDILVMKMLHLQGKGQLRHYLAQSRLLEYQSVQQEKLLRTELSVNIVPPGIIYQVTDMVNFLSVYHVRKELKTYLK